METPIAMMYRAAKTDIPAEAAHIARIANHLQQCIGVMDVESAHAGEPAVLTSMLHVAGQMHAVLQGAVTSMDNCSVALLLTANDYVATDDQARADYDAMGAGLKNAPTPTHDTTPLPNPNPQDPGATVPLPPGGPYPPGQSGEVEPNAAPQDPDDEREDRGDGSGNEPGIPEIDRDWD